jgi:ketosteroid isomerase-like protein
MVDVVRRVFDLFERGDIEGMLEHVHPDGEFLPIFMDQRPHRGRTAIREIFEGIGSRRRWRVDDLEVEAIGDRVLAEGRLHSMTTIGTVEDYPIAWVIDVEDGRLVRMQTFVHRRQARAAIGGGADG